MLQKRFTIKTPLGSKVNFDLIDTEFWQDLQKKTSYKEIDWQSFHYRNDSPAYLLVDGRVVHKYFYNAFLHLYSSMEEFLECYKKDIFYFVILYHNPKPELFYYYFDVVKPGVITRKHDSLDEEDEFHKAYISNEDNSVIYVFKPHVNLIFWFENKNIFERFLPYYIGKT